MAHIAIKRVYEPRSPDDGVRILVDRIWPRGITKQAAAVDHWMKDLAPSTGLRQWFGHDPTRWDDFRRRYLEELAGLAEPLAALRALTRAGPITLVYAARDEAHNQAVVLREALLQPP